jgi:large subunit ribosomal protein L23
MIESTKILKRVVISERAVAGREKLNQYVFEVAKESNKVSVAQAVEAAFKGVKVAWVNIANTKGKAKRILTKKGGVGYKSGYKKAIVCLKEGKIELN